METVIFNANIYLEREKFAQALSSGTGSSPR